MTRFKKGDQLMVGPLIFDIEEEFGDYGTTISECAVARTADGLAVTTDFYGNGEFYPWHPALPKLALWLRDWPGMPEVLETMPFDLYEMPHWKHSTSDSIEGFKALLEALNDVQQPARRNDNADDLEGDDGS